MTDHPKPGWAVRTVAALLLLLAYPVSFGPACWITSRYSVIDRPVSIAYRPLCRVARLCPDDVKYILIKWGMAGESKNPDFASPRALSIYMEAKPLTTDN